MGLKSKVPLQKKKTVKPISPQFFFFFFNYGSIVVVCRPPQPTKEKSKILDPIAVVLKHWQ